MYDTIQNPFAPEANHYRSEWLSVSIFCSRSHWNQLLNEISLLLHKMQFEDIHPILLQFNYLGGDNIRWALYIPAEETNNFTRQIDDHFRYFFSKARLPVKEFSLPVVGNFFSYPTNSIQFGLYTPVFRDDKETMHHFGIRSSLSRLMIEKLASDTIDDETIVTFAFYLHLALMKLILTNNYASIKEWRNVHNFNSIPTSYPITIKEVEDNREKILDIANEIINPDSATKVPVWLKKWLDMFDMEIKELTHPWYNIKLLHYRRFIYHLHMQLGITAKMESLLFFYLYHIYRTYLKGNRFNSTPLL
jgi:hypothetical protein